MPLPADRQEIQDELRTAIAKLESGANLTQTEIKRIFRVIIKALIAE